MRLVPPQSFFLSDRSKLEWLMGLGMGGIKHGVRVRTIDGALVTSEDVEAIQELLEPIPSDYTGPILVPSTLRHIGEWMTDLDDELNCP